MRAWDHPPTVRVRALLAVAAALASWLTAVPARAGSSGAELLASRSIVDLGETVTLSGSLSADPGCSAGRTVELQWRPADSSVFGAVAEGVTAADGSFAFEPSPDSTGRLRADLPGRDA